MKSLIINAIAFFLLTIISFGSWAQSKDDLQANVAKMNQEMIDLTKTGRYELLEKFYDANVISLPNNRVAEKGFKQVLTSNLQRKNGGYKILEAQKTTTELFVSEDMLVDVGTYSMTITYPGPPQPTKDAGKYINVWKKNRAGEWKIVAETWNSDKSIPTQYRAPGKQDGGPAPEINQTPDSGTKTGTPAPGTPAKTNSGSGQKPVMDTKDGKK